MAAMIDGVLKILDESGKVIGAFEKLLTGQGHHNVVLGKVKPGDEVLYEESIRQGYEGVFSTTSYTFEYECKGNETITCVFVKDNWGDDTNGSPEKLGGGPGKSFVKIRVTSRMERGLDFSFYVYGRK